MTPLDVSEGVALYTDGSSSIKDRSGGWAWLALDAFDGELSQSGCQPDTTNNRMELWAWIHGLAYVYALHGPCQVLMYSDSEYVGLGAMNRTRRRKRNLDMWAQLDEWIDHHNYVEFVHVKGHAGHEHNERVDKMAGKARLAGLK